MMQLGIIGLGTMGANLARNAARNGIAVAVFNRTTEKMEAFVEAHEKEGNVIPCKTLVDLLRALNPPRAILIMVKAGEAVDQTIEELLSLEAESWKLKAGDILIDGGNSHYRDTERRERELAEKGIRYLGMGISGGEKGALFGPSLMIGGSREAYDCIRPLLQKIAATIEDKSGKQPCVALCGPGGAGHFVKIVHNGIEYGLMQLIAEAYHFLRSIGEKSHADCVKIFTEWNAEQLLSSYLLGITAKICRARDQETGQDLLSVIKDTAGQKGTGQWAVEAALRYGAAIPAIAAALDARLIAAQRELRIRRSRLFPFTSLKEKGDVSSDDLRSAILLANICAYAQGFDLLERASAAEQWNLPLAEIARVWRGGCIIRSDLLRAFQKIFAGDAEEGQRIQAIFGSARQQQWRTVVAAAIEHGIPVPALGAALHYFDAFRSARLPANLTAAQRDFFGAHGYERTDRPGTFRTAWE